MATSTADAVSPEVEELSNKPKISGGTSEGEESNWTVQSSTKTRRLVPQFSLTRQDMGADNNRGTKAPPEIVKKKVVRFTKEELLELRKPANKILPSMSDMLEILSLTTMDPVCFEKLEPEDVIKIWNIERNNKENLNRGSGGRGRGRGKDDGASDYYSRENTTEMWDSSGKTSTGNDFDLADFAAAALKFRAEMQSMELGKLENNRADEEEDAMRKLLEEQMENEIPGVVEEGEELPDWADENDIDGLSTIAQLNPTVSVEEPIIETLAPLSTNKTSLLLETLNMRGVGSTQTTAKQSTEQTRNSINSERQPISIGISAKSSMEPDLRSSLQQSALTQVLEPLPASIKVDWFYLDPQNQIQGPFSQENMRLWNEGGYFRRDLPIKLSHWTSFYQFAVVFQDLKSAFNFVPPEPGIPRLNETSVAAQHLINSKVAHRSLEDQSQIVRITEEKQVAPQVTQQQTTDLERTKTAHVLSTVASTISSENDTTLVVEKENSKVSATVDAVTPDESALKTLDTISLDKTMESKNKSAKMKEEQEKRVTKKSDSKKGTSSGTVNDSVSNKNRKQDSDPQPKLVQEEISQKVNAWGPDAAPGGKTSKTLAEIQMEEEKNKLVQQEKSVSRQPSLMSNHLKSLLGVKSSGGSRSWVQPDSVAPREARALNEIMEEEAAAKQQTQDRIGLDSNRSSWAAKAGSTSTVVTSKSQQSPTPSIQQSKPLIDSKTNKITAPEVKNPKQISNENSFGGKKMSKEVMEWCSSQLRKLNGSEDITLLQFCMSLESAVEVREYLAQYLGSTPQVTNFATEFIKIKEGKIAQSSLDSGEVKSASVVRGNAGGYVSSSKKKKAK